MLLQSTLAAIGSASLAAAVATLEVQGNRFVNPKTNTQFQVVGAAYQIGGSAGYNPSSGKDPLSHVDVCKRDAALMQSLGVNTIRVYNLSPDLNHDECASVFNAAGIYMLIDVNSPTPGEALNSAEPWTTYTSSYLNRTFAVVDNFKNYPNTLAFFAGNEVINDVKTGANSPPYVRAVVRDLKNYIKKHADRQIPVGYSAADVRSVLEDTWNFFQCAIDGNEDDMSRSDVFALNSYSWCGDSNFKESGYDQLVDMFKASSVPIFYSEFGCNTPSPRVFTEVPVIYSDKMTPAFSGGVVYEYAQEENNYGLAKCKDDGSVELMEDYDTLKKQYASVDFDSVQSTKFTKADVTIPECKQSLIQEDGFSNNFTLPNLPPGAEKILNNGVDGALVGKIVDISDWKVTQSVKSADGQSLTGLAVEPLSDDESNTPGKTSSGGTSSGSGGSGSDDTKDGAAPRVGLTAALAIPFVAAMGFLMI
ncbi:glycoside hydrolase family 72 protein [Xylariomycetidae sp. FL0641]|nr:glycoside hydrolase family 72 protein [Xylariomycetidae sp. FL0641]